MKKNLITACAMFLISCGGGASTSDTPVTSVGVATAVSQVPTALATASATTVQTSTQVTETDDDTWEPSTDPVDPKDMKPPMEAIKNLDKRIEDYTLGTNLSAEQQEKNRQLKKELIRGTFDIKELCRLALAKHWSEITEIQQREFVKLMVNLLERKAVFSKDQLHGEAKLYHIQYLKEKFDDAEKTKATVTTKMFIPKDKMDLDLTYKMTKTPYGWKIFDVIVDDASLLLNYKTQFHNIIEKSGYEELVSRMRNKLKEIK